MLVDGSFGNIQFTGEFTQGDVLIIVKQQTLCHVQDLLFTKKEVLLSYSHHLLGPYFLKNNLPRICNFARDYYKTKVVIFILFCIFMQQLLANKNRQGDKLKILSRKLNPRDQLC